MKKHSFTRCWIHIIWSTINHQKVLSKEVRTKVSNFLFECARSRNIYLKINYVNADHIHILIDLPFQQSLREVVKYFKGSSSHWINQNKLTKYNFNWGGGFGAFSVSQSNVSKVAKYIATQNEHHHKKSFLEEYKDFIEAYGLQV